jgi:hypothetical protein
VILAIRNWSKYQHYKNRPGSPWVKFYVELLDDDEFCSLSDSTRLAACLLLLVASRRGNRIPDDAGWLAAETHIAPARAKVALAALLALKFLVPASELASGSASESDSEPASGFASPRAHPRTHEEAEVEVDKPAEQNVVLLPAAALPNESLEELGQRLEARTSSERGSAAPRGDIGTRVGDEPLTPASDVAPRSLDVRAAYGSVDSVYEVIDKPAGNTRRELEKWLPQLAPNQVEHVREQTLACEPRKSKAAYAVGTAQKLARERGAA